MAEASRRPQVGEVRDLNVDFWVNGEWYPAVIDASFDVSGGRTMAIVGESGSGKSTIALAMMGLLPDNADVRGSIVVGEHQIVGLDKRALRSIRGQYVSMIFQEPMTALNPVYTIGFQIAEMLRSHMSMSTRRARERAITLLELVEIPEPQLRVDSYPHELSGGQRQRAMIAQALACDPVLLIADEPTTALDVTVQAEILKLLRELRDRIDAGIVLITHDMGVVADLADDVIVMQRGRIVEAGSVRDVYNNPSDSYTQALLAAVPHLGADPRAGDSAVNEPPPVTAAIGDRRLGPPGRRGRARRRRRPDRRRHRISEAGPVAGIPGNRRRVVVDRSRARWSASWVNRDPARRRSVVRSWACLPFVEGAAKVLGHDMVGISRKDLGSVRRDVSFVFQDPGSSLNPRLPVGESIGEPLRLAKVAKGAALDARVEALLDQVELVP